MTKISPKKKTPVKKSNKTTFTLTSNQVHALFGSVTFATDSSDSRFALGSVLFIGDAKGLTTVATNGRHMAWFEGVGKGWGMFKDGLVGRSTFEVLVSDKDIRALLKLLPAPSIHNTVVVTITKTTISFKFEKGRYGKEGMFSPEYQLVESRFPRWRDSIPNSQYNEVASMIQGTAEDLLDMLPTSDKQSTDGWVLNCKTEELTKPVIAIESWRHSSVKVTGDISIKFNVDYLASWLSVLPSGIAVTINLYDEHSPIYCTAENGASYILMPIRKD